MRYFVLAFAFVLAACGPDEPRIDPLLRPVLYQYLSWAPNEGKLEELVSFEFGHTEGNQFGYCSKDWVNGIDGAKMLSERRIVIKEPSNMGGKWRAGVMHELAHCLHDKGHSTDSSSLMFKQAVFGSDEYWEKNLEAKVRELF